MKHLNHNVHHRSHQALALAVGALLAAPGLASAAGPAVSFALGATFPTGGLPRSIATGDLNGDGKLDLAIANQKGNSVSVVLGNGDGTFVALPDLPLGGVPAAMPYAVALGDLDGDGTLDLVTANYMDGTASILLGNGDGTFVATANLAAGPSPSSLALGKVNGDDILDIVIGHAGASTASVLLGLGGGIFLAMPDVPNGSAGFSVALGDLNGDGKLDLATANFGASSASILLGNGDGTFLAKPAVATGALPISVAIVDLNGDGKRDLVTGNFGGNTASILFGNGDGTFLAKPAVATGTAPAGLALGDLNGDSLFDLVTANYSAGTVGVLLGNGDGTFQAGPAVATGLHPDAVAVGDFDGDGKSDWAVTHYLVPVGSASVFLNSSPLGLWFTGDTLHITPPPRSTFGTPTNYTIQYNTQARISAGQAWGIWAKNWPANQVAIDLGLAQTLTGCRAQGAPNAWCYRPPLLGEQGPGQTYVYRVFASTGAAWSPASLNLSVTRP